MFGLQENAARLSVPALPNSSPSRSFSEIAHARAHEIRAALTAHSLPGTFGSNPERHTAVEVAVLHPYGFCVDPQRERNGSKRGAAKQPFDHKLPRSISRLADSRLGCECKRDFRNDHMPVLAFYRARKRRQRDSSVFTRSKLKIIGDPRTGARIDTLYEPLLCSYRISISKRCRRSKLIFYKERLIFSF
jgi:hypothetical protein